MQSRSLLKGLSGWRSAALRRPVPTMHDNDEPQGFQEMTVVA